MGFLHYHVHFYDCYYSQHVSLVLLLICSNVPGFCFFSSLGNYLCFPLSTLHSQASCNSLEKRFSALSLETGNRTGLGFRLLFSLLELKMVPILTEYTAYPLQMFISLQSSVPELSCVVCSGGMAKCCEMPASIVWKVSDHASSKGSSP